ncbi:DUF6767 domain-containing protein [Nigerium massiliense]|uniref:DUF6767 domain-containing protein n=1 Tax=Nigerium massiliense TaxID=1522317 RepID=UPI00058C2840|nr:DUF6767 domain-containing protein [Nigerium massiliense]
MRKSLVEAKCPIRPGEKCSLCQMGVSGPHDCGLVYLVMHDDELRELYAEQRRAAQPSRTD